MKKIRALAGVLLFVLALSAFPLVMLFTPDRSFSENENRYLSQKPQFSVSRLMSGEFMEDMEKYLDDQFPLRNFWTAAKSELLLLSGSREINGVYWGAEGYLIERWAPENFDETLLRENIAAVETLGESRSMPVSLIPVPTAGLILEEKLPEGAPMFDQDLALALVEKEFSGCLVDLREVYSGEHTRQLYYRSDHHWTSYAALLAYCQWRGQLGENIRPGNFYSSTLTDSFRGSLYSKVLSPRCRADGIELYERPGGGEYSVSYHFGKTESASLYAPERLEEKDKYRFFMDGNHPELTISTSVKNGKHLLVLKDSFANCFIPFLTEDYETIHVVDPRYFKQSLADYMDEKNINECLVLCSLQNLCQSEALCALLDSQ